MGRLLKQFPAFLFLAKGLAIASGSVLSTLALLMVVIYVFAIVFVQLLSGTAAAPGCFENIPQAVNCLFLNAALADQKDVMQSVLAQDALAYASALLYFVVGSLTIMNMLIGALCEVVSVVAREQSEHAKVEACKEKLTSLLIEIDANSDLRVSRGEFVTIMANPDMVRTLAELEVDVEALIEYADVVFDGCDEFELPQFVDTVLQFRASNSATVKDLAEIRRVLATNLGASEGVRSK